MPDHEINHLDYIVFDTIQCSWTETDKSPIIDRFVRVTLFYQSAKNITKQIQKMYEATYREINFCDHFPS